MTNVNPHVVALCEHYGHDPNDVFEIQVELTYILFGYWARGENGELLMEEGTVNPLRCTKIHPIREEGR